MRYTISGTVFLLLLLTALACLAGSPKPPSDTLSAAAGKATGQTPAGVQLTQLRWVVQTDDAVKETRLRLILDVSGPVEVSGAIADTLAPSLVVNIKGAAPEAIQSVTKLDGRFADSVSLSTDGRDTKLAIALSFMADDSNCRIFTLPADAVNNKPFRVVVDISEPAPPPGFSVTPGLKSKVIVLDPGHGGSDTGAIGPNQTMEKTITFAVAQKTRALLEQAGATVILTRQEDCDVFAPNCSAVEELQSRVNIAANNEADVFLSIHANAAANPLSNGTGTFYYKKTSNDALLAYHLQRGLIQAGGLRDRSFFPANFYVVKQTKVTAALLELAFISNENEERLLNDPDFQLKMAQGIVQGLDQFFTQAAKRKAP